MKLYGIPNCETVKKARAWLDAKGVAYDFHDYKKQGVDRAQLERWVAEQGWEAVLNRAGMTILMTTHDLNSAAAHLPMHGAADSLNVPTTAAVLLYEATRQRGLQERSI